MQTYERSFGFSHYITAQFVLAASAAGMTALALASPASAANTGAATVHERVVYRDLDLSTRQGAHILVKRIETAVRNLCEPSGPRLSGGPSAEELRCRSQATARAIAELGSPQVSAEYVRESGHAFEAVAERP